MDWTYSDIRQFVQEQTGEEVQKDCEGPAKLGEHLVWRQWTWNAEEEEYHAHYVIGDLDLGRLKLHHDFQPFSIWLGNAFSAQDRHVRRLDVYRSFVASIITLTLLALLVWAVLNGRATGIDYKWLAGALAATSLGYLLGGWVRKPTART